MKRVYDFLSQLAENNNREWFEVHKQEFLQVQDSFNLFVGELIREISVWDKEINPEKLKVKDCTYRIYRDVRFSKNKLPYKTHMGAYVCKGGKKSSYAGYYIHIEPGNAGVSEYLNGCHLFTGLYKPEPKIIKSLREEISLNGDSFLQAIEQAEGFDLTIFDALKKVPKGYEAIKSEWQELLKLRDYSLCREIDTRFLFAPHLAHRVSEAFRVTKSFENVLNKAVQYAQEEM